MPKPGKKKESNLEFQRRTFPKRLRAVESRASETLGEQGATKGTTMKPPTKKERASAERALKAAGRIRKRLGTEKGKVKKVKPTMKGSVGTTVQGLKDLYKFGKRVKDAPGAFKDVGK